MKLFNLSILWLVLASPCCAGFVTLKNSMLERFKSPDDLYAAMGRLDLKDEAVVTWAELTRLPPPSVVAPVSMPKSPKSGDGKPKSEVKALPTMPDPQNPGVQLTVHRCCTILLRQDPVTGFWEVLLGYENRNEYYTDFGGRTELRDQTPVDSAARELSEETGRFYPEDDAKKHLQNAPFILNQKTRKNKPFNSLVYVMRGDQSDEGQITARCEAVCKDTSRPKYEREIGHVKAFALKDVMALLRTMSTHQDNFLKRHHYYLPDKANSTHLRINQYTFRDLANNCSAFKGILQNLGVSQAALNDTTGTCLVKKKS